MGVASQSVKITHQMVEMAQDSIEITPNFKKSHIHP